MREVRIIKPVLFTIRSLLSTVCFDPFSSLLEGARVNVGGIGGLLTMRDGYLLTVSNSSI